MQERSSQGYHLPLPIAMQVAAIMSLGIWIFSTQSQRRLLLCSVKTTEGGRCGCRCWDMLYLFFPDIMGTTTYGTWQATCPCLRYQALARLSSRCTVRLMWSTRFAFSYFETFGSARFAKRTRRTHFIIIQTVLNHIMAWGVERTSVCEEGSSANYQRATKK